MSNTWIRHTCYNIRMHTISITLCQHTSATVTHFLNIYPFIRRSRISIVYPQERTNLHLASSCRAYFFYSLRCHIDDLARSQFLIIGIAQVNISMTFKWKTVRIILLTYHKRCSPIPVPCTIDSFFCHDQHRHRTIYNVLYIFDSFYYGFFLTD